jgi:CelD/BcsL family acetyltransferase involved in cellulose biosynthesis
MKVSIIDTEDGFEKLERPWNELAGRCSSSLFSGYDYNRIAWKYFHGPADSLFILTMHDGSEVRAIAPFRISVKSMYGIPARTIEFIAAWEGDKPSITAPACEEAAWEAICAFLTGEFSRWDVFSVMEQPRGTGRTDRFSVFSEKGYFQQLAHDSSSYHIDLTSCWDSYLATVDGKVKRNWRSRSKKLEALPGGLSVETISEPGRMTEALDRFAALERMSWKGKAGIGVHSDPAHRRFYEELTRLLAGRGQAYLCFLREGEKDLAGMIVYQHCDVVYERHVAYNPEYAALSPGIYLKTSVLQHLCGKGFKSYDMMGMHPNQGVPLHKADWATGSLDTECIKVFRRNLRMLPVIWGKRVKERFRGPAETCQ